MGCLNLPDEAAKTNRHPLCKVLGVYAFPIRRLFIMMLPAQRYSDLYSYE